MNCNHPNHHFLSRPFFTRTGKTSLTQLSLLVCAIGFLGFQGNACSQVVTKSAPNSTRAPSNHLISAPQRLSQWLTQRESSGESQENDYLLGLMWSTPEEMLLQQQEYTALQKQLSQLSNIKSWDNAVTSRVSQGRIDELSARQRKTSEHFAKLNLILQELRPTGKVRTAGAAAKWLEVNPKRDPFLKPGDTVEIPTRPSTVRVMSSSGVVCETPHQVGLIARDYVKACQTELNGAWGWIAEPDGRVVKVGLSMWNPSRQEEPAPGAWIWAPDWLSNIPEEFSDRWARWLATQGVSSRIALERFPSYARQVRPEQPESLSFLKLTDRQFEPRPTASDWGYTGLLQTPSARMRGVGTFSTNFTALSPYTMWNNFFQPLEWMEGGFRYTSINNRDYDPGVTTSTYKDKSLDLKVLAFQESDFVPAVALGVKDLAGTGLFSSEYVVSNKRIDRLDFSLGVAFGNLGARGGIPNPLGSKYKLRAVDNGDASTGGTFNPKVWFHGPGSLFAGVEYATPIQNLILKAEYDSNNYQHEPLGNSFVQKSPLNLGLVYSPLRFVDLSLGVERGNTVALGVTLYTDLSSLSMPKLSDPPLPALKAYRPTEEPNWRTTAIDIQDQTQWRVNQIYKNNDVVSIDASKTLAPYTNSFVDKAVAIVNRDAPQDVNTIKIEHRGAGSILAVETIDRESWVNAQTQPSRVEPIRSGAAHEASNPNPISYDIAPTKGEAKLIESAAPKFKLEPGLDFIEQLDGPGDFLIYQFSAALHLNVNLPYNFELKGMERARLFNNYDKVIVYQNSSLHHVRSDVDYYFNSSEYTLTNLSLTNAKRVSESWYVAGYGGFLEEMFGGAGAEIMYRQPGSVLATTLDINRVTQRSYRQDFNFQDYKVTTGHLTQHWITPLDGIRTSISVGHYLAGDVGATFSATKTFRTGVALKAYFTRTNVPYAVFGEGSFDKGILISVPFDSFMTRSSADTGYFAWAPLVANGGQMLRRPVDLYMDDTRWVAPDVRSYAPPPAANDELAPDDQIDRQYRLH